MLICEGMLVKNVLDYLNKQFQVGYIGRPEKYVASALGIFQHNGSKNKKCFVVNEKTKFLTLALICSSSTKKPIKFVNETVGILAPNWSVKVYLRQLDNKCTSEPTDKRSVILKLIASAELFSDLDWVLRVMKNSKIYPEQHFIEQLHDAIIKSPLPLDEEQRSNLCSMLKNELMLRAQNTN